MNSTGGGNGGWAVEAEALILRLDMLSIHRRSFSSLFSCDGINGGSTAFGTGGGGPAAFRELRWKSPPSMLTVPIGR